MNRILKNKFYFYLVTFILTLSFVFSGLIIVNNSLNPSNPTTLSSGVKTYMKMEGISVNSDPPAPSDSIIVNSLVFAGLYPSMLDTGVRTSSRLQISDVVVEKFVDDQVTPQLWDDFFRGVRINEVIFYVYTQSEDAESITLQLTLTLTTVYVSSMINSFTTTSLEQITFSFMTFTIEFVDSHQSASYELPDR